MRITRDTLLKIVRDTVSRRSQGDRGIMAVYLCGSLLGDGFLLGGAADIDLVAIHSNTPAVDREVVALSEDVNLDFCHHLHRDYRNPRQLRVHPWLGPTLYSCDVLYDPQHFLDFTQASVRGQFYLPEHVMQRARPQAEHSRQMWNEFYTTRPDPEPAVLSKYLRSLDHAANSIGSLSDGPMTERRFLIHYRQRAEAAGKPGLFAGFLGLIGGGQAAAETMEGWMPAWQEAYSAAAADGLVHRLHPARLNYYRQGILALLHGEEPKLALWPLLRTWTHAMSSLPQESEHRAAWTLAMEELGLGKDGFQEKVQALDAYLDLVEETLEAWAAENGALE